MDAFERQRQATIHGRMCTVMLPVLSNIASTSPNAIDTPKDLMDVAITQCRERKPVATTIRIMRRRVNHTMTGQRFLQLLGSKSPDDMLEINQDMMDASGRWRWRPAGSQEKSYLPETSISYFGTRRRTGTPRWGKGRRAPIPLRDT